MTADEWHRWALYRRKNGPLNPMLRIDSAIARAAAPFLKAKPEDLMPWPRNEPQELTVDSVLAALTRGKK